MNGLIIYRFRLIFLAALLLLQTGGYAQCPGTQLYDLDLAVAGDNMEWVRCSDNTSDPDAFTLELISPADIVSYEVDWGDGTPVETGGFVSAGTPIPHTYTDLGLYNITFTEIDGACTGVVNGVLINDRKPGATAIPPTLNTSGCAPHTLTFTNTTTNLSPFTNYRWEWGDGEEDYITETSCQPGSVCGGAISHTYQPGTSGCDMEVRLTAMSLCDTSFVVFGPYDMWDLDTAIVAASATQLCVGDDVTFTDVSNYNCVGGARRIRWDFSELGGAVTGWLPATPANRTQTHFVTGNVGDSYTVYFADSNFCGIDYDQVTVTIVAPPTAGIDLPQPSICAGQSATFNNTSTGATNYAWNFGDGSGWHTTGGGTQSHTYTVPGNYTVRLAANRTAGQLCTDTAEVLLEVRPGPRSDFDMDVSEGCDSLSVMFTEDAVDAVTWEWSFDNGTPPVSGAGPWNIHYPAAGLYVVTLDVEDVFGCTASSNDTVKVFPSPDVSITGDTVCQGDTLFFTNQTVLPLPPSGRLLREKWNGVHGSAVSDLTASPHFPDNPTQTSWLHGFDAPVNDGNHYGQRVRGYVHPPQSGNYFFWVASDDQSELWLSTDADPANKSLIAHVPSWTNQHEWTRFPSQEAGPVFLEAGQKYYIEALHKENTGGDHLAVGWRLPDGTYERPVPGHRVSPYMEGQYITSWLWDFGDGNTASEAHPGHVYAAPGTYEVTLTASTGQCQATDTVTVRVAPSVLADFEITDTVACTPLSANLVNTTTGADVYYWNYGDGSPVDTVVAGAQDTIPYTWYNNTGATRIYTVTLTAENSAACTGSLVKQVVVHPGPQANFHVSIPPVPCSPFEATITNLSVSNDTNYTWYMGNYDTLTTADPVFNYTFTNTGSMIRLDTVRLEVLSQEGCMAVSERIVTVFPAPDFQIVSPDTGCHPFDVPFSSSAPVISQVWDFGDGHFSAEQAPQHTYTNTLPVDTTFTVQLIAQSLFGCSDTVQKAIVVAPPLQADFVASPAVQVWPSATVSVINMSTGNAAAYTWEMGDGTTQATADPPDYTYTGPGDYTILLTVSNPFCTDTMSRLVRVLPQVPVADFDGPASGCLPLTVTFTNQSSGGVTYLWEFGDGHTSTEEHPTHMYTAPGTYSVKLTATNPSGSHDTTFQHLVTVYPAPVAFFQVRPPINKLGQQTFFSNQSVGGHTYWWDFGDGNTSTGHSPFHTYADTGYYDVMLAVTTNAGCTDTFLLESAVYVEERGKLMVPSAFTPNGDNLNDVFRPMFENVEAFYMAVFDRWGEMLFETRDIHQGWDGYYKGRLVQQDVYIYKLRVTFVNGETRQEVGDVTLLR